MRVFYRFGDRDDEGARAVTPEVIADYIQPVGKCRCKGLFEVFDALWVFKTKIEGDEDISP